MLTLHQRADAYATAFRRWPSSHLWPVLEKGEPVLYGKWMTGNDYRNKTKFYGAYPKGYLERMAALFPDVPPADTLHCFSGSLPPGAYVRCDMVQPAELQCSVYDLPARAGGATFALTMADPPYTSKDAERYGTPMIVRSRCTRALAHLAKPGDHLAWLDTVVPLYRKDTWRVAMRITLLRSTGHRVREVTVLERRA